MITGTVRELRVESQILKGNPLGDPDVRGVPIYLPPVESSEGLPLVAVLAGYTGIGAGQLYGTPWDPSFLDRYEMLFDRGEVSPCAFFFPDCFTRLGGSQYMNSSATGLYRDHLIEEVLPLVEEATGAGGERDRRGVMGKSSGGYGSFHLCFEHPDLFSAVVSHSGDAGFDLCYRPDFGHLLEQIESHGGVEEFVEAFEESPQKTTPLILAMGVLAMSSAYSPDPGEPLGIALPFEPRTGRFRPEVWDRWMAWDPVTLATEKGDVLKDFHLVFVDCGTRDEYQLQYGARQLVAALKERGVAVQHEEFDDGHRGIGYRVETSLPLITAALSL